MLLWLSQWRILQRKPWLLALAVLGIAVGVAGVLSIDLTIHSARRAFTHSLSVLGGRASHVVRGGPGGLPEKLFLQAPRDRSAPLVEGTVHIAGKSYRLIGVDPFFEGNFRVSTLQLETDIRSLIGPGSVAVTRNEGFRLDQSLELESGHRLRVSSVFQPADPAVAQALKGVLVCDIATAQEVLGMVGRLSRIEMQEPGITRLGDYPVEPAQRRSRQLQAMTDAFFMNLQALSLLSLLVGGLLIYSTSNFFVVHRQAAWDRLRTFGVTRRELLGQVMKEALLLGSVGAVIGMVAGAALAGVLLKLVTQTINDLYYRLEVTRLYASGWVLARTLALGLLTCCAATFLAARDVGKGPVRQGSNRSGLESRARSAAFRLGVMGALVSFVGHTMILLENVPLEVCLAGILLCLGGLALLTPGLVVMLNRVALLLPWRPRWLLAIRGLERSLSRTGVALAALTLAVSSTVAIGEMVHSFRASLNLWLDQTLQADVYVTDKHHRALDPALVARLRALPELRASSTALESRVQIEDREVILMAVDLPRSVYWIVDGAPGELLISQPLHRKTGLRPGDRVTLRVGAVTYQTVVNGVFFDYTSEQGMVVMPARRYAQILGDTRVTGVGLYLREGAQPNLRLPPEVTATTTREIKEVSREIFERTFAVTGILRWLATLVASLAILGSLGALHLEKRKEVAVWEALGMTRKDRLVQMGVEVAAMGCWAGVLAVPYGILQTWWMTAVLNPRAFGWDIPLRLDPWILLQAPLLAMLAALATLPFAWRVSQHPSLTERLREE